MTLDGNTSGPDAFSRTIGKAASVDLQNHPIGNLSKTPCFIKEITEDVLTYLSQDQKYLY